MSAVGFSRVTQMRQIRSASWKIASVFWIGAEEFSVEGGRQAMRCTASISAESPFPLRALVPTTGMFNCLESSSMLTWMPFFLASSIRFTQRTARSVMHRVCKARLRLRSRQVASQTMMVTSALPLRIKSRVISSSCECGLSEYVPGKSTITNPCPLCTQYPCALSTVLPGQFPVC